MAVPYYYSQEDYYIGHLSDTINKKLKDISLKQTLFQTHSMQPFDLSKYIGAAIRLVLLTFANLF